MIELGTFRMVSHWRSVSHRSGFTLQVSLYFQFAVIIQHFSSAIKPDETAMITQFLLYDKKVLENKVNHVWETQHPLPISMFAFVDFWYFVSQQASSVAMCMPGGG